MVDNTEHEENESYASKYKEEAKGAYKQFDEAFTIRKGDNFIVMIGKVLGRVLTIGFFILISPFVAIGLFLAVIAAG